MAKKTSILDVVKVVMRGLENFGKYKKTMTDISNISKKLIGKKDEGLTDEQVGIVKEDPPPAAPKKVKKNK